MTPLELFFDLVYVFAIGQLSHHLLEHVDLRTGAETLIMALAVIYAWYMTAWGANWLDPDRLPVRLLLVGLMFASLLMAVAIPDAFDDRAWLFVTGYLVLQIGRSVFLIFALRGRQLGEHFVNDLVWELLSGCLWVAGALADGDARLVLWGLAVVVTQGGVWILHWLPGRGRAIDLEHTDISGGHLIERFRLFFIIALGRDRPDDGHRFHRRAVRAGAAALARDRVLGHRRALVVYFQRVEGIGVDLAESADDAGAVGWQGTWTLTLIVLASDRDRRRRRARDRPSRRRRDLGFAVLAFAARSCSCSRRSCSSPKRSGGPRSRLLGLAALVILAVATSPLTLIVGIAASSAVLVAVAVADTRAAT